MRECVRCVLRGWRREGRLVDEGRRKDDTRTSLSKSRRMRKRRCCPCWLFCFDFVRVDQHHHKKHAKAIITWAESKLPASFVIAARYSAAQNISNVDNRRI